ncbi:biotin synthase auxiliary protein BsaP [Arthrobacter pascens]|uniref:biotin synthase auxiliary protein BsaP n=1 Tax=Arthrobacter pascens TaxID=1677 RepID=UPI004038CAE9
MNPSERTTELDGTHFCGHCGGKPDGAGGPPSDAHQGCDARLQLEPPRFCRLCGRRLKVQVSPLGWWAACSRHGVTTG